LKPTPFTIGGKKYYLHDVISITSSYTDVNFFEFQILKPSEYEPDKILVWVSGKTKHERKWTWFIYLKREGPIRGISYHYSDIISPEKDTGLFLRYVRRKTPDAIPHILFNYLI
jgi:hypothetical protein